MKAGGKGVRDMGERILASGGDALRIYDLRQRRVTGQCALPGAGALCAGGDSVYVACEQEGTIWRLDAGTLMPRALFTGGPGICRLLCSEDGKRLYALCADSDSLLMLDARSGAPLVLCRVGVGPEDVALDEAGDVIAVAGGACGDVILLSAHSLTVLAQLHTSGVVHSVALHGSAVYALSFDDTMNTVFSAFLPSGMRREHALPGMPGALAAASGALVAATHECICLMAGDGARTLGCAEAAGRAGRLLAGHGVMAAVDVWSETLRIHPRHARQWCCVLQQVRDAVWI